MSLLSWLDQYFSPPTIESSGTPLPVRTVLEFEGAGAPTITDDTSTTPARTKLNFAAGGGSTPTGTGLVHVVASMVEGAASLLVDADVDVAAEIAGSKISPLFGAQAIQGASLDTASAILLTLGGTNATGIRTPNFAYVGPTTAGAMPTIGAFRAPADVPILTGRYNGTTDYTLIYWDAGAALYIGGSSSFAATNPSVTYLMGNSIHMMVSNTTEAVLGTGFLELYPAAAYTIYQRTANDLILAVNTSTPMITAKGDASAIVVGAPTVAFDATVAAPAITQADAASDVAAADLTIRSQAAFASATVNQSPGNIVLAVPARIGAEAAEGKISMTVAGIEALTVSVNFGGTVGLINLANHATTTTAPGAGGAGALPATPTGYVTVEVNGTSRQLPYY